MLLGVGGAVASGTSGGAALVPQQAPRGSVHKATASAVFSRALGPGNSGSDVSTLQRWLQGVGYSIAPSGYFGSGTQAAVRQFQQKHKLPMNGTVEAPTAKALYNSVTSAVKSGGYSGGVGLTGPKRKHGDGGGSSTSWVFPLSPVSRVLGPSYWSQDQGVDIPPVYGYCGRAIIEVAMTSGTIVQEGIQGFGGWAPVLQIDSGAYKGWYLYYGHAMPDLVSRGEHVHAGQPIAEMGCGDVGYSTGPHIEIGITPPNQGPCCPQMYQTSQAMWDMVQKLYYKAGGH